MSTTKEESLGSGGLPEPGKASEPARADAVPAMSPLPWTTNIDSEGHLDISPDGGDMVCDLKNCRDAEANAAFIVTAVNAHRELVSVLNLIVSDLPANRDWLNPDWENQARALLAKLQA